MNGSLNEKLAVAQLLIARFYLAFSLSMLAGIGLWLDKKHPLNSLLFTFVAVGVA